MQTQPLPRTAVPVIARHDGELLQGAYDCQGIPWPSVVRRRQVQAMRRNTLKPYKEFKDGVAHDFKTDVQKRLDRFFAFAQFHRVPHVREQHFQLRYNLAACALPNTLVWTHGAKLCWYDTDACVLRTQQMEKPGFLGATVSSVGRFCAV